MKKVMVGIICVLAVALICIMVAVKHGPSDEDQIRALVAGGESAIEHKSVKGVMSCVSKDYTDDNGLTYDEMRAEATTYFMQKGTYDVQLSDTSIRVMGNTARVETLVSVHFVYDGGGRDKLFSGPIDLILHKEKSRRWLVIPTRSWKVTSTSGLPEKTESLL